MIPANVGRIDRVLRIVLGLLLLAFAVPIVPGLSFKATVLFLGMALLFTAGTGFCPVYFMLGRSTRRIKNEE